MVKDGTTYTINGSFTDTEMSTSYKYENLVIGYDGSETTSVSGKMTTHNEKGNRITDRETTYSTEGSTVKEAHKNTAVASFSDVDVAKFYGRIFTQYNADTYASYATESQDTVGNVTAKVYTVNGQVDTYNYENMKFYVYQGYVIKQSGLMNDKQLEILFEISVA